MSVAGTRSSDTLFSLDMLRDARDVSLEHVPATSFCAETRDFIHAGVSSCVRL